MRPAVTAHRPLYAVSWFNSYVVELWVCVLSASLVRTITRENPETAPENSSEPDIGSDVVVTDLASYIDGRHAYL